MKKIKLVLKWIALIILALIISISAYVYINQDKIIANIVEEFNKTSEISTNFENPSLSIFSNFPNIGVSVDNLILTTKSDVKNQQIFSAKQAKFVLDIASVLNKSEADIVRNISFVSPVIEMHTYKDGTTNYTVQSEETEVENKKPELIKLEIKNFQIENGSIRYFDHMTNFSTIINKLNVNGAGKISGDNILFDTKVIAKIKKTQQGKISIFDHTNFSFSGIINSDLANMKFDIKDALVKFNELVIDVQSNVEIDGDDIIIDSHLITNNNSFKQILSLIPSLYTKDYDKIKTTGTTKLDIKINGVYNDKSYPHVSINNQIKDASITTTEMTESIDNINLDIKVDFNNPSDFSVLIPSFHFNNNNQAFDGQFEYKDKNKKQLIDLKAKGNIDLSTLSKSIAITSVKKMTGIINTDIILVGNIKDIVEENYQDVKFEGFFKTTDLKIDTETYPSINISNTYISFNPKTIDVSQFRMSMDQDIIEGKIKIIDPLAVLTSNKSINIISNIRANQINIDQWVKTPNNEQNPTVKDTTEITNGNSNFQFDVNAKVDKIIYDGEEYLNNVFIAQGNQDMLKIEKGKSKMGRNEMNFSGTVKNYMGYLDNMDVLDANLNISSKYININDFIGSESTTSTEQEQASGALEIPKHLNVTIHGDFKKLIYDDIDLSNMVGDIIIKDEKMKFDQLSCNAFDGNMDIDGYYSTATKGNPKFSMTYNNSRLAFSKTFAHVELLQRFMPIMKYMDGLLSTDLVLTGSFDDQFNIIPNSVTADGYIETLNAKINEFSFTKKLSKAVGLNELKSMKLVDSKNWFTIKDGIVNIKEFKQHIKGIDLRISGNHKIDQSIDYLIKAHVPRALLKKNGISNGVNVGIDYLQKEASKLGVNINTGSHIDIDIKALGTLLNPKFKIVPTGTSGKSVKDVVVDNIKDEANEKIEYAKDSIRRAGDKILKKTKDSIRRKTNEIQDSIKQRIEIETERAKTKAIEVARKKLETELAKKVTDSLEQVIKNKANDALNDKSKEEIEKLKDKIEDWNPFKKKK